MIRIDILFEQETRLQRVLFLNRVSLSIGFAYLILLPTILSTYRLEGLFLYSSLIIVITTTFSLVVYGNSSDDRFSDLIDNGLVVAFIAGVSAVFSIFGLMILLLAFNTLLGVVSFIVFIGAELFFRVIYKTSNIKSEEKDNEN